MADPNNCATCEHKRLPHDGLHCYMFKIEPKPLCMQHQDRKHLRLPPNVGMFVAVALAGVNHLPGSAGSERNEGEK